MKVAFLRRWLLLTRTLSIAFLFTSITAFARDTATGMLANGRSITLEVGQNLPWSRDIIRDVKPEYPASARLNHYQGSGVIRLTLDLKTGLVTSATIKRSTGYRVLDESALKALRRWRWKPGTWKQVDAPVAFTMEPAPMSKL
jgi:TonB family protein